MNGKPILAPADLEQNSFDEVEFVAGLAGEMPALPTLLYVMNLNVSLREPPIADEIGREYEGKLRALGKHSLNGGMPNVVVRIGKPHLEILAEAEASRAELIVMASAKRPRRKWRFSPTAIQRVIRVAPCLTLALPGAWKMAPAQYRGPCVART